MPQELDLSAFGGAPQELDLSSFQDPPKKPGSLLKDMGQSLKSGVEQLPGMVTGLADIPTALAFNARPFSKAADAVGDFTGFRPGKWAKEVDHSQAYKDQQAEVAKPWAPVEEAIADPAKSKMDAAKALWTAAPELAATYLKNPGYTLNQVVESLPSILAGGWISKGLGTVGRVAGVAENAAAGTAARAAIPGLLERKLGTNAASEIAGGIGEGAVQTGQQMDGYQGDDARKAALASLGSGAGDALIAMGAGRLAHAGGFETANTAMAKAGSGAPGTGLAMGKRVAGGMLTEGIMQELPQSAQEQVWQNWQEGKPLMEGVLRQGVEGALSGAVIGAGANVAAGKYTAPTDPAVAPPGAAPTQPLLGYNNVIIPEAPRADGQGTTPIDPNIGPLSAAAADAIKSGLTPTNANRVGTLLRNYATKQDAQDALDQREDGARMDIIPHPRGKSGFAIVPKSQSDIAEMDSKTAAQAGQDWQNLGIGPTGEASNIAARKVGKQWQNLGIGPTGEASNIAARKVGKQWQSMAPEESGSLEQQRMDLEREGAALSQARDTRLAAIGQEWQGLGIANPTDDLQAQRMGMREDQNASGNDGSGIQPLPATGIPNDGLVSAGRLGDATSDGGGGKVNPAPVQSGPVDQPGQYPGEAPGATLNVQNNEAPAAGTQAQAAPNQAPEAVGSDAAPAANVPGAGDATAQTTRLDDAAHEAATSPLNDLPEPTQAQKEAGNYKVGRISLHGLNISIENPEGSVRRGVGDDGKPWENTLAAHYGYIRGTEGNDGDHVDTFIGPNPESQKVFVVDQVNKDGSFDEHKVILGAETLQQADKLYHANYHAGWTGRGAITEMPIGQFKDWVKEGTKTNPVGKIPKPDLTPASKPTESTNEKAPEAIQSSPQRPQAPAATNPAQSATSAGVAATVEADSAPVAKPDLTPDQQSALDGKLASDFERQFQQDLKDGIKRKRGLIADPADKAAGRSPFKSFLITHGISDSASDIVGERNLFRANQAIPRLFRRTGLGIDELVNRAAEAGFITESDRTSGQGVEKIKDMIQSEIAGKQQLPADMADDAAEAAVERNRRMDIEEHADSLGLPYDNDISTDRLASMVKRVERYMALPKNKGGLLKADRVRANALEVVARIERKRAQYEQSNAEFAKASQREQDAIADVLLDSEGMPVINRVGDLAAIEAWLQENKEWDNLHGNDPDTQANRDSGQAGAPDAQGTGARAQDSQGDGAGQQRAGSEGQAQGLTAPTESDALRMGLGYFTVNNADKLASMPGGTWVLLDGRRASYENGQFNVVFSWGNGKWSAGDTASTPGDTYKSALKTWTSRGNSADSFKPANKGEFLSGVQGPDLLSSPTREDVLAQQAQAEQAAKDKDTADRKADKAAREEDERKRIAKASEAAAGTFELGGNALDNLTGQGGMFARGPWRSALRDGLSNINAKALSPEMWADGIKGLINKGAVKEDEVEWSGIREWLDLQTGKVSKEDVLAYLDANGVKVTETKLGDAAFDATFAEEGDDGRWYVYGERANGDDVYDTAAEANSKADEYNADIPRGPTKYSQYTLPGGENYREVLLTLPEKKNAPIGGGKSAATMLFERDMMEKYAGETFPSVYGKLNGNEIDKYEMLVREDRNSAKSESMAQDRRNNYKSSHWDQPNVLAHVRLNDRVDSDGKRVLFVEEIQSDWGQEGKKQGFADRTEKKYTATRKGNWYPGDDSMGKFEVFVDGRSVGFFKANSVDYAIAEAKGNVRDMSSRVPAAPFVDKTDKWLALALKRIVKLAVDGGYDKVAFVNGEQSADRYDLSKQVRKLAYQKNADGTFKLSAETDANGSQMVGEAIPADKIEDYAGKEIAKKIIEGEGKVESWADGFGKRSNWSTFTGLDLKMGGEGMKAFYDKIVPSATKALLKKLGGGQMESVGIDTGKKTVDPLSHEELRRVNELQVRDNLTPSQQRELDLLVRMQEEAKAERITTQQPGFTITPAMREKASEGLPLFARETLRRSSTPRLFMPISEVQQAVDQLTAKWKDGPRVKVVATPEELPIDAPMDARGLIHNGTVYIVAANHRDRDGVARTLGHEAVGHYGLWKMLGEDGTRKFQAQLQLALRSGNVPLNKIAATVRGLYVDQNGKFNLSPRQEANEIAAFAVESAIDADGNFKPGFGFFKAVWAKVAAFLRDLGITVRFTNAELQGMLVSSMKGLEAGKRLDGGGQTMVAAALGVQQSDSGLSGVTIKPAAIVEKSIKSILSMENATAVLVTGGSSNVLRDIARKFGKQIIFFRVANSGSANGSMGALVGKPQSQSTTDGGGEGVQGEGSLVTNGFTNASRPDVVFLNADSTNHLAYIIGHELGHTLRMDDPALWHKMGRELWPLVRKWREYKDSYDDVSLSDKDKQEELLSDVIGHNFADPAFWDDMAKQNQPMFQRIAAKVIELLDKAISVFGGRDVTVYITDMKKARSIVANAMAQYAAAHGANDHTAPDIDGAFARGSIVGSTKDYPPDMLRVMDKLGWQVEVPTLKERAQALWKDAGKKMAQGIVDQFAPVKDLDGRAYGLLRLAKGASGAFETLLKGGMLKLDDGTYNFDEARRGGVINRLLKPLQGEHHNFFRWVAAQRANALKQVGKENLFDQSDIDTINKWANTSDANFDYKIQHGVRKGQTTRNRAEMYRDSNITFSEFNKNVLDMAEQSGLIDGATRHLWENEFYVPFYRVSDDADGGVRGMNIKGAAVRQQAFKTLKGGKQKLNADLLENTLMNWAHLLDASAKNRAAKATIEAAEKMGVAMGGNQSALASMGSTVGNKNGVVWFMDGGQKRYSLIDNQGDGPYIMTALSSLEYAGMRNPVMNAMGAMKHALTVGVTASPFFKVRNLIRDSVQVVGTGPISYNVGKNLAEGWKLTDPKSDAYFQLLAGGGTIHFGTMTEGSEAKRVQALVESGVNGSTILDSDHKLKAFYRKYIEPGITAYNELGNRGEAVNRAALYNQLRKQGMGHAEASLQARDLMDFSMQGSWTSIRFLTQVVPFMNARIQGLYKLGKAAKEDPARFSLVLGATAMASLSLLAAYGDDDDWKKRTDSDRNNFWWFKVGGTAFRIPKPFEIGAIGTLAERGFELAFDKEMDSKRFGSQVLALLSDQLSMNPVPQAVKPILDVYANIDSFSGTPIENMAQQKLKSEYRFNDKTTMTARGVSTALNAATGLIGKEAYSPVDIDHLLRGYFGWLGTMVVSAGDYLARPATGQPDQAREDYLKKLTGNMASDLRDAPSRYVNQMYTQAKSNMEAYDTWRALMKEQKPEEAKEFFEGNKQAIVDFHRTEAAKKSETLFNNMMRMVERNRELDPDQKRERIRVIQAQKEAVAKRAVLMP